MTDRLLYKISAAPATEVAVTEAIERVVVPLVLDLPVDVLFIGRGIDWLSRKSTDNDIARLAESKLGLLPLYGLGRAMALIDQSVSPNLAGFALFPVTVISPDELESMLQSYRWVR